VASKTMVKIDQVTGETKIRKDMVWYDAHGKKCKPPSKPKVYCIVLIVSTLLRMAIGADQRTGVIK
jgi:hypothetical protein